MACPAPECWLRSLRRYAQTGRPFPPSISRSELIRNLSVFISCLEWVGGPGDGNHALLSRARKKLALILDEVLDCNTATGSAPTQPVPDNTSFNAFDWDSMSWPSVAGFDGANFDFNDFNDFNAGLLGAV